MALPATDAFTDSNSTTLPDHDASWVYSTSGAIIVWNNRFAPGSTSSWGFARWTDDAFNANQYSQAVVSTLQTTRATGPAARIATDGADTGYLVHWSEWYDLELYKVVAGSETEIGSGTKPSASDLARLEASGTSITVKINGGTAIGPITDSAIASGAAGVGNSATATGGHGDDWEAGNLAASAVVQFMTGVMRGMLRGENRGMVARLN